MENTITFLIEALKATGMITAVMVTLALCSVVAYTLYDGMSRMFKKCD